MTSKRFRRRVSAEVVFIFLIDGMILYASLHYGVALRYVIGNPYEYGEVLPLYPRAVAYTVMMLATLATLGVYARDVLRDVSRYSIRFVASFLIGAILMMVAGYATPRLFLGRGSIALTTVLAMAALAAARYVFSRFLIRDTRP